MNTQEANAVRAYVRNVLEAVGASVPRELDRAPAGFFPDLPAELTQQARNEAYDEGYSDGHDEGHAAGWAEGHDDGITWASQGEET